MRLEDYFDFFENPYAIRLKGHPIGLEHIIERYHKGYGPEMIVHELPSLSLEETYPAITYYLHNKEVVDAYMAEIDHFVKEQVRLAEANPSPASLRMRKLFEERWRKRGA